MFVLKVGLLCCRGGRRVTMTTKVQHDHVALCKNTTFVLIILSTASPQMHICSLNNPTVVGGMTDERVQPYLGSPEGEHV